MRLNKEIICIRGAGDIATGVIQSFARAGFRVYATEIENPTTIRRTVALSEALFEETVKVEDLSAKHVSLNKEEAEACWEAGMIPILTDPDLKSLRILEPSGLVDCILAKKNLGTKRTMAKSTIALGPGFTAGEDVNYVVETMRGHNLGRIISNGKAMPNTGVPGEVGGESTKRVIHAPCEGVVHPLCNLGDYLIEGAPILQVDETIIKAPFTGTVRGLLREGLYVVRGFKIADIDPRKLSMSECRQISDKARAVGGSALTAYLMDMVND